MIRSTLNLILTPEMRLGMREQLSPSLQHILIESADRHADGSRILTAPEEPAPAGSTEPTRAALGGVVPRERRLRGKCNARVWELVEVGDEGAAVFTALGALAG